MFIVRHGNGKYHEKWKKTKKETSSHGSRINRIKVILIEFCLNTGVI